MSDVLATMLLTLAIAHAPPGRSPHSYEKVKECGTQKTQPACRLEPMCEIPVFYCKPPKWSAARGAWVRVETPEHATCRYARITKALSQTARRLHECKDASGSPIEGCTPVRWRGSTKSFALAILTVALHESGLREDIQNGIAPLGRGAAGEACLIQVRPNQAARYASWLTPQQRAIVDSDRMNQEKFIQTLLGDSVESLERCFEVGGRMLARSRRACEASSMPWDHAMFSMYGTGATCNHVGIGSSRKKTFSRLVTKSKTPSKRVPNLLSCKDR